MLAVAHWLGATPFSQEIQARTWLIAMLQGIHILMIGLVFVSMLMIALRGGNMRMAIPFGVFLGPAAVIALYVGPALVEWYAGMYR